LNRFFNDLLKRPRQQKVAMLAGAIILLAALYYTLVYDPRAGEIAKLQEAIASARSEKTAKQSRAANLVRLEKELVVLDVQLKQAMAQLPDRKEIPDLLANLSSKAREAGLEILLFRPRVENFQEFYAEIPVDIVVRGGFVNAVAFFEEVGRLNRIVNIDNLDFRNPKVNGDQVALDISTMATTYRFLDDAERKKVAEEKAKAAKKK